MSVIVPVFQKVKLEVQIFRREFGEVREAYQMVCQR